MDGFQFEGQQIFNGNDIPNVPGDAWGTTTNGAWCYYNNDVGMNALYGKLYNWYAVTNASNICPSGWRVPDDVDWEQLSTYLGGSTVSGGKMKGWPLWSIILVSVLITIWSAISFFAFMYWMITSWYDYSIDLRLGKFFYLLVLGIVNLKVFYIMLKITSHPG